MVSDHVQVREYCLDHLIDVLVSSFGEYYWYAKEAVESVALETAVVAATDQRQGPSLLSQITDEGAFALVADNPRDVVHWLGFVQMLDYWHLPVQSYLTNVLDRLDSVHSLEFSQIERFARLELREIVARQVIRRHVWEAIVNVLLQCLQRQFRLNCQSHAMCTVVSLSKVVQRLVQLVVVDVVFQGLQISPHEFVHRVAVFPKAADYLLFAIRVGRYGNLKLWKKHIIYTQNVEKFNFRNNLFSYHCQLLLSRVSLRLLSTTVI